MSGDMKVSISMVTYNHEQFIAKAIDSVLMQKTDFDYEIVIGEDCSRDGTRSIVLDYQRRYPDKIRLLLNEKNIGMHKNGVQTVQACTGEYVAMLEGDDYWTSPCKLQKQVDFLDEHRDCVICFHNALLVHEDGSQQPYVYCPPDQNKFSTIEDLLIKGNFLPTCSKMYRRSLLDKIPEWVFSLKMGDWPIDVLISRHGNIGYINEIMGEYRIHHSGVWFGMRQNWEELTKANMDAYHKLYSVLEAKYKKIIRHVLHEQCVEISEKYDELGELDKAKEFAGISFTKHFIISARSFRLILKFYFPLLFQLFKSINRVTFAFNVSSSK